MLGLDWIGDGGDVGGGVKGGRSFVSIMKQKQVKIATTVQK